MSLTFNDFFSGESISATLANEGIELDQRMEQALEITVKAKRAITDVSIFAALLRLNPSLIRHASITPEFVNSVESQAFESVYASGIIARKVFERAVRRRSRQKTLGTKDFLISLIEYGLETGDSYRKRPFSIDLLTEWYYQSVTKPLSESPQVTSLLNELKASKERAEDFQFILLLQGEQLNFRVVSVVDDYVQQNESRLFLPQRAIITHFKDRFGGFTQDEIEELEYLLNSRTAKEIEFQQFFEQHTHFFRRWDYREVYAQVALARPEGSLVPDFILTDRELQKAAILDLKLPSPKIIRRQHNRDRFSTSVMEARTQLLRYRDWFREKSNRLSLVQKFGMEIYEPRLIVIIGRASEFQDEIDRQRLSSDNPDIEVVTYDEILTFVNRRRMIIQADPSA